MTGAADDSNVRVEHRYRKCDGDDPGPDAHCAHLFFSVSEFLMSRRDWMARYSVTYHFPAVAIILDLIHGDNAS